MGYFDIQMRFQLILSPAHKLMLSAFFAPSL